jgi:hypothetical protein
MCRQYRGRTGVRMLQKVVDGVNDADAFAAKWLAFATVIEICSTPSQTVRAISKRALGGQLRSIVG